MKRLWIVLSIIVIILLLGLLSLWHLYESTIQVEQILEEILIKLDEKKIDQTKSLTDLLIDKWDQNLTYYVHYIHQEELDQISGAIASLNGYSHYEDYEEMSAQVEYIRELIFHMRYNQTPGFKSVF